MTQQQNKPLTNGFGQSVEGLNFTQKAFQEVEALFRFMESTTPDLVLAIAKGAHDAIDSYVDRSAEEKDCLKALTVIDLGHDFAGGMFLFDDMTRYSTLYSPQFSEMAFSAMRGEQTENSAQIDLAIGAGALQLQLAALATPQGREETLKDIDIEQSIAALESQSALQINNPLAASAPALLEKVKGLTAQFIQQVRTSVQQTHDPKLTP